MVDNFWSGAEVEVDVTGENVINVNTAKFFISMAAFLAVKRWAGLSDLHFWPVKFVATHDGTGGAEWGFGKGG